jgi:GH18 family chitinase
MTYDYHGSWDDTTNFDAPLYPSANDPPKAEKYDVDDTAKCYLAHETGIDDYKRIAALDARTKAMAAGLDAAGSLTGSKSP